VIFYDITSFQRGGFLPIISIYSNPGDIWFLLWDICKNLIKSQPQHVVYPLV